MRDIYVYLIYESFPSTVYIYIFFSPNSYTFTFQHSIKTVDQRIHDMLLHQSQSRAKEARDFQLLISNNNYVQYWSLAQCIAIIGAGAFQVFYLRKLFDTKVTTKSGGRA